jgi:hypothetical protein
VIKKLEEALHGTDAEQAKVMAYYLMLRKKKWQFTLDTENIRLQRAFPRHAVFDK